MRHIKRYREIFESTKQELTEDQMEFIEKYTQGEWYLSSKTGLVDIDGDFNCSSKKIRNLLGIKFGNISGDFDISYNMITSLLGGPVRVDGNFDATDNDIESLEGSPRIVGGNFECGYNFLKSLDGGPEEVGGSYYVYENPLESLRGFPKEVGGYFSMYSDSPQKWDTKGKSNYILKKWKGWEMLLPTFSPEDISDSILKVIVESPGSLANIEENPELYDYILKKLGWDKMGPDLLRQIKMGIV